MIIFIIPDRIISDHISFSEYRRNNQRMMEEISSLNVRIIRWDLIPNPVPLQTRFLAKMIPPNPIREIIIFIIIIIFLIYTLIAHTVRQPHPEAGQ